MVQHSIIKNMVIRKAYCSANCKAKGQAKILIAVGIGSLGITLILISISTLLSIIVGLIGVFLIYRGISNDRISIGLETKRPKRTKRRVPSEWERIDEINQQRAMAESGTRNSQTRNEKYSNDSIIERDHVPKINVEELGKEVLACCYQSARLGQDMYCVCGRVVTEELKEIFLDS